VYELPATPFRGVVGDHLQRADGRAPDAPGEAPAAEDRDRLAHRVDADLAA
jgi:hypothetical protein